MAILALDHVQIAAPAGCEARARAFYGEQLGLIELEKPTALRGRGGVWFALGEQQLHIGVEEAFAPALKAHPALLVSSGALAGLVARLTAAGTEVAWDHAHPGVRRCFTADPFGNRIELIEAAPAASGQPPRLTARSGSRRPGR